jgi:VWFA-related protein
LVSAIGLLLAAPAAPGAQQPTFRAGATLVRVDVTVVTRDGEPVTDLTAEDFEVEEDGVLQKVEACRLVSADGRPPAGDDVSLAIRSREHAAAEAARDDVRVFLIFWDEYHISRFGNTLRARQALASFVTSELGPTDLVALMDPLLPVDALEFTRDHASLAERIRSLPGRRGQYVPTRSAAEEAMLERGDVARLRTEVTMSALKAAAVHLGSLREGRKSILFVSEGFVPRFGGVTQLQDVIQSANNNNAAIYALDPSGLSSGVADVLRMLADNTGGEAIVNSNVPARALRQIVKDSSAFYFIGYSPTRAALDDGRFHQIRVRVRRPGVSVRARRGYWAPSAEDVDRAARDAAVEVPVEVSRALAVLEAPRPGQVMDVWVGTSRAGDGSAAVNVAWTPRAAAKPAPGAGGTLSISVEGDDGKRLIESTLEAGRTSFTAKPGAVKLYLTTRDATGAVLQEDARSVTVPDYTPATLLLSSPEVFRAQNVNEYRALAAAENPAPHAGREFVRTDRLLIRFALYGNAALVNVSARLMSRSQQALVDLPVRPVPGGSLYQVDLPLASIARGDFLIEIEAVANDDRATALVPLRVTS